MKLAIVVAEFPCLSETFILRELQALSRLGFDLTVYSLSRMPRRGTESIEDHGFELVYRPGLAPLVASSASLGPIRRHLDLFISGEGAVSAERLTDLRHAPTAAVWGADMRHRGIDWVHGHFAYVPSMVASMCAQLCCRPFSFAAHAWDLWCTRDDFLLRSILDEARFAVVCSDYGRNFLLARAGSSYADKVHRIYHGLVPSEWQFSERRTGGRLRITAVGRLVDKKGFGTLLRACSLLAGSPVAGDFECVLVGEGPLRRDLQRQSEVLGLAGRVRLMGALPHAETMQALHRANVCVVPSVIAPSGDRDGLPNVVLEAAAMGVPLVTTDVTALPEFVHHGETGLVVPPQDPEALAQAIVETASSPVEATRRTVAARNRLESQFHLTRNVEALAALFTR